METQTLIYLQYIRNIVLELPGTSEGSSYGTDAFFVQKKILARIKEDGQTLVVFCVKRDVWMQADPATFFITDHYLNYDYVLVNLATVNPDDLKQLLTDAWLNRASKTLIKQYQHLKE